MRFRVDLYESIIEGTEIVGYEIHTYYTEYDPNRDEFYKELLERVDELIENPLDAEEANVFTENGEFVCSFLGIWENYDEPED